MTTQSLISFLNSFDNQKLKDNNRTSDTSTIDNFTTFRNVSKQLKKKNYLNSNINLSISNNKTINNPIKPNHNLILSEELSKENQSFNNPSIITFNKNNNSNNSSFNHFNTIDINRNYNHHNQLFYIKRPSKIKLNNGISQSDYNLSYYNQYENLKNNTNSNLVNIVNEDNDDDNEINFNKYGIKILSENQKNNLKNQIIQNESINDKLISIHSKKKNNSIDMNNEDGFILKNRRKSYQTNEFKLQFIKKNNKKKISLDTINRNRLQNEFSNNFQIIKNENFNISSINNSKSRNINKNNKSNYFSYSNEGSLEQNSNIIFRKTYLKKQKTLILKNLLKIKNINSQSEKKEKKNIKSLKFDSDNNSKKGIKEDFMTKLYSYSRKRANINDSFYKKKYFNSAVQKKNNDEYIIPNFILKKEQTPYQINKLKNSLLNKKYLPISTFNYENQNNNIINFTSSNSEEKENKNKSESGSESDIENYNDYRQGNNNINYKYNTLYNNKSNNKKNINLRRTSLIENIPPENALSIISQDKNSYVSLNKDSFIYVENPENDSFEKISFKRRNKKYLKQLSKISEVMRERISLLDTKFKSTKYIKNDKFNFKDIKIHHSLPLPKIYELKIKFKKKKNISKTNIDEKEKIENENLNDNKNENLKDNSNDNLKVNINENLKDNPNDNLKDNINENLKNKSNDNLKDNVNENLKDNNNEDLKEDLKNNKKDDSKKSSDEEFSFFNTKLSNTLNFFVKKVVLLNLQ